MFGDLHNFQIFIIVSSFENMALSDSMQINSIPEGFTVVMLQYILTSVLPSCNGWLGQCFSVIDMGTTRGP